jgi:squalene-associated FAD-dependent desaturase
MRALVVGAGLAGLAAAIELAKNGAKVTLAERRGFAGGRAYSFLQDGEQVDNGQHVFLGCCESYLAFLDEIGGRGLITLQERTRVPFVDTRTGKVAWIVEGRLPAPCHFLPSILKFHPLTGKERRGLISCARAMMKSKTVVDATFGAWLREHHQSEAAIRDWWDLLSVAILNEHVDVVSAKVAIFVFKTGFFGARTAARVGYATAGLGAIAAKAVERAKALGVEVKFNTRVERVPDPAYDVTISAVPWKALLELVKPHPFFEPLKTMDAAPIVNLHVTFDREVAEFPFAAYVGSPLQWVFDHGRRVVLSLSAAREFIDVPNAELEKKFVAELKRVLPRARDAKVVRCTVIREKEATFVATPGVQRLPCETPVTGLYLAGEWTESDWPSTMEAAVASGTRAARRVLGSRGG